MGKAALAVDLGASGGRLILGRVEGEAIRLTEVCRFPNDMALRDGHLRWDGEALLGHITGGLRQCAAMDDPPATLGIDSWGVDYALLDAHGRALCDPVAYRDARTAGMPERLDAAMDAGALYAATGVARQPYNTLYQLMAEQAENPAALARARTLLFTPCYLSYRLTGVMRNEYSIASTSGMLDARTRDWHAGLLRSAGIPAALLGGPPAPAGTVLGPLSPEMAATAGFPCDVVLTASHDTASAYLAAPASAGTPAVISSGTWSLLGVELDAPVLTEEARLAGFTNEGGYGGRYTFLRNITGLWLLQCIRREWQNRLTYEEMAALALRGDGYPHTFDVADARFLSPASMTLEVAAALRETGAPAPENDAQLLYSVHRSLAVCYRDAVHSLAEVTGTPVTAIHVVGGGCQNRTLNQMTADETGLPVYAGPAEATALGNLAVQWLATRALGSLAEARRLIRNSVQPVVFAPRAR